MREEGAGRHVDRVDARLDQPLAHAHRVVQRVAGRADAEERHGIGVLHGADLHLQVEVAADALADRADDVEHESRPVLERAAVFVLAIVDRRAQELRDQVAVGAVQLDAVEAGLARAPRAFRERVHRLLDVGDRHRLAAEAVRRIGLAGRAQAESRFRCPGCRAAGPAWLSCRMNRQSCSCTALPTARQKGMCRSWSIIA